MLARAILAVLAGGPLHGYAVRTALRRRIGSFWPVNQGQVYATLSRLERRGLIEAAPSPPGDPRRCWALSPRGAAALRAWLLDASPRRSEATGFDDWSAHLAVSARRGEPELVREALNVQRTRVESLARALASHEASLAGGPAARLAARILETELAWLREAARELFGPDVADAPHARIRRGDSSDGTSSA